MVRRAPLRAGSPVLLLGAAVAGCSGSEAANVPEGDKPHELVIFVYDRSTSIPDHTLHMAQQLTNQRLEALTHGDRIAGLQVLQLSLAEPPLRWSQEVPIRQYTAAAIRADSLTRARFLRDVGDLLADSYSDPEGRENITGTDLLSTMHDVAEELRPYPDRRATFYLFSDMLQSTREIEMEGLRNMPPKSWISQRKARDRLPDLSGLCVVVVGARVDTEVGQRVKAFWKEYFEATGATLLDHNYMLRPVELPLDPCPEAR